MKYVVLVAVIVVCLLVVRMSNARVRAKAAEGTRPLSTVGRARVEAELGAGRRIEAIAAYRKETNCSLLEAKEAIDRWPAA